MHLTNVIDAMHWYSEYIWSILDTIGYFENTLGIFEYSFFLNLY